MQHEGPLPLPLMRVPVLVTVLRASRTPRLFNARGYLMGGSGVDGIGLACAVFGTACGPNQMVLYCTITPPLSQYSVSTFCQKIPVKAPCGSFGSVRLSLCGVSAVISVASK